MDGKDRWEASSFVTRSKSRGPGFLARHLPRRLNRVWAIQWGKDRQNYIRLFPNPGWQVTVGGKRWHWCRGCWENHHRLGYER